MQDRPSEPLPDAIERMTGKIVNALVIAAAILALAIYARPGPPKYQAVATGDGRVVRVNTSNGAIVSCDASRCLLVHSGGHSLDRAPKQRALPPQPAPAPAQPQPQPAAPPR
jgi:hypothetical protein